MSSKIWNSAESDLKLNLKDVHKVQKVQEITSHYILTDDAVEKIKKSFQHQMDMGLNMLENVLPQGSSTLSMKVTFITDFFNGKEKGEYVIIDLHSQHLLLVLAKVKPGFPIETIRKYIGIDEKIRREPYIKLFEFASNCILKFFSENNLLGKKQSVGFCTNLPSVQLSIERSTLCYFTASASDFALNEYDVCRCFEIVLCKETYKDVIFDMIATMSDNTSLFFYSCYRFGAIDVLLNLVNDCDIVYCEKIEKVGKWKSLQSGVNKVIIDTEMRNFGGDGSLDFITTDLDWAVIAEPLSITRAPQLTRLEKFISERYVLELIRHILVELSHNLVYCRGADMGRLHDVTSISLTDICNIANSRDFNHGSRLLPGGSVGGTQDDAEIASYVCKVVLIRAALLTSICLSSTLMRYDKDDFMVAARSCLIENHPFFETYIRNFLIVLAPGKKFQLLPISTENICYEGAALVTAIANRLNREDLHF